MLILAMTLGRTLVGCDGKQPASTSGSAHSSAAPHGSAESPPGNPVQIEMRMLTSILEATVRAIGARDVRPIEHALHRLHAAKETTTAALRDGSYKLPKNHDQVRAFVAMDEAFHEHLKTLVSASHANDIPATANALGSIVRDCEGCHVTFRPAPSPTP